MEPEAKGHLEEHVGEPPPFHTVLLLAVAFVLTGLMIAAMVLAAWMRLGG